MAQNLKAGGSRSEDLILKMIAQDLDVEDQLPFGKFGEHVLGGLTENSESTRSVNDYVTATSNSHEDSRIDQQILPREVPFSRSSSETRDTSIDRKPKSCENTFSSCSPSVELREACSASTTLPIRKSFNTADEDKCTNPQFIRSWTSRGEEQTNLPKEEQHEHRFRIKYDDPPYLDQVWSDSLSIANMPDPTQFGQIYEHTSPYPPDSPKPPFDRLFVGSPSDPSTWTSPPIRGRSDAKSMCSTYNPDDPSDSPSEHDIFAPAYLEERYAGGMAESRDRVVRYKGVEYTFVAIPWAGKPGWVEREVDRSFDREELGKAMRGRRQCGKRTVRSAERMERARRREEEATVVEIEIGDDETLDSIITGMIAQERREKKGKGKAVD